MNKFENIVVYLDGYSFEKVKELLLSKGEKLCSVNFELAENISNYLKINEEGEWELYFKNSKDKEISLEDFKKLINE